MNSYKLPALMGLPAGGTRLRIGAFEVDVIAGELIRDGERVRLQEQPRQVLAALLERPGEVMTREELRERLWKSDTFVDFEHGLNTAIKKVRQALGDSAESPQFIETLARRGYRFVAPVTVLESIPAPPVLDPPRPLEPSPGPVPPTSDATPFSPRRVVLAVVLVAAVGMAGWLAGVPAIPAETNRQAPARLAVLPLRVLSAQGDATYLGVGIADAITTRLANVRQMALRPTAAVLGYTDGSADPARVASALDVDHLVVGTIQEAGETYRVSVQLVKADGVAVWGRAYDVPRASLLSLQDSVAEQVASALRVELSAPERARLAAPVTDNPTAYDLYLRGRALLVNYTDANMREAITRFEEALALDPEYARARAALATACAWFSVRFAYESEAAAWSRRAEEEARRALAQDPSLAEAHLAIAQAAGTLHHNFDFATVLDESATALALEPSLDLAHVARARAFYHLGLFDEAREEVRQARALNPTPNIETERLEAAVELFGEEFTAAARHAAALLQRTDAPAVRHYLGLARFYEGDVAGARAMLASAKRGGQPDVRSQASLASIEAASGARVEARTRAAAIAAGPYIDHHVAYSLGAAYAQLGEPDESVRWLQRAADSGFPCYPWFDRDPLLRPLRGHAGFTRLLDRLRAAHAETSARVRPRTSA